MSIQRHPVESYDLTRNFWEEFPDYKIHPTFGPFWGVNKKAKKLKYSSHFMWVLALCYDRKSSIFPQPERDKWEVACENVFNNPTMFADIVDPENPTMTTNFDFPEEVTLRQLIVAFEHSIDTPLGLSLRLLESKLLERTEFITSTKYSVDYYKEVRGKQITMKGTADQLDKMFAATDKINSLVQKAMDELRNSEGMSEAKGGEEPSLGDGKSNF